MATDRSILVRLGADITELQAKLRQATSEIDKAAKGGLGQAAKAFDKIGGGLTKAGTTLTAGLTLPLVGAGVAMMASAKQAGELAEKLNNMQQSTGLSTDKLQVLKYVADNAGLTFETVANASAMVQQKLLGIEEDSGAAADAMKRLGIDVKDGTGQFKSMNDLFPQILAKLQGMTNQTERNAVASQIFGKSWKELAPILGMSAAEFAAAEAEARKLGVVMSGENIAAAAKFDDAMDKVQKAMQGIWLKLGQAVIPLLEKLAPIVTDKIAPALAGMVDKISNLVGWFGNLSDSTQKAILIFGGIVVGIGPALIGIGNLMTAFSSIIKIAPFVRAAGMVMGSGMTLALGPIGLIIAGIAAVGIAVAVAYKKSEAFRDAVQGLWTAFKDAIGAAFAAVKTALGEFWNAAKPILGFLATAVGVVIVAALRVMIEAFTRALNIITPVLRILGDLVGVVSDLLTGNFAGAWKHVEKIALNACLSIVRGLRQTLGFVPKLGGQLAAAEKQLMKAIKAREGVQKGAAKSAAAGNKAELKTMADLADAIEKADRKAKAMGDPTGGLADKIGAYQITLDTLINTKGSEANINKVAGELKKLQAMQGGGIDTPFGVKVDEKAESRIASLKVSAYEEEGKAAIALAEAKARLLQINQKIAKLKDPSDLAAAKGEADQQAQVVKAMAAKLTALKQYNAKMLAASEDEIKAVEAEKSIALERIESERRLGISAADDIGDARVKAAQAAEAAEKKAAKASEDAWRNAFDEQRAIASEESNSFLMFNQQFAAGVQSTFARLQRAFQSVGQSVVAGGMQPAMAGAGGFSMPAYRLPELNSDNLQRAAASSGGSGTTIVINGDGAALMDWTAKTANGEAVKVVKGMSKELRYR